MKSTQGHFQRIRVAILLAVSGWSLLAAAPTDARASRPSTAATSTAQIAEAYGKLPFAFEANHGQTDAQVKFLVRGSGYTLFLTGDEAVLSLRQSTSTVKGQSPPRKRESTTDAVLRMKLVGANPAATVTGLDELPGKSNYFIGNDPKKWRADVPNYAKVRYQGVYPGIDLVYYGNQGQLESDFMVAPCADPRAIALDVTAIHESHLRGHGRATLRIDRDGDLVVRLDGEEIRFHKPVAYQGAGAGQAAPVQIRDEDRKFIEARYVLKSRNRIGIRLGEYDAARPLIIDPVLTYSSYLGGSGEDFGFGIAVDGSGNAYLIGNTTSPDFPQVNHIPGSCKGSCGSGTNQDVFVTKINAAGGALVYSTYVGGSSLDYGRGIAVDRSGNAYLTGHTDSTDFPRVSQIPGACQGNCGSGDRNAFVTKINAAGSALVYSSYLGGSSDDEGVGIAVDASGNADLAGFTLSTDFPRVNQIPGACQGSCGSGSNFDVFVTKVNAPGNALVYSSYLGGSANDGNNGLSAFEGIAVDSSGNVYLTGVTLSTDFPRVNQIPGACQGNCGSGGQDAFVTKINAAGNALVYSSYLGGSSDQLGFGIVVDGSGNAYVTGSTASADFPRVTQIPGACRGTCGSGDSFTGFLTKINAAGSALVYSSLLGGSLNDEGRGIAVDGSGNAYLTGDTLSTDFPRVNQIPGACQGSCGSGSNPDAFVTKINAAGSALVYSTYLGGANEDDGLGIAVDGSGNAYLTGVTLSADFPRVSQISGACQGSCGSAGNGDAFVTKISPSSNVSLSPTSLDFGSQGITRPTTPQVVALTNTGELPLLITSITIIGTSKSDFFIEANTCPMSPSTLAPGNHCNITVVFFPHDTGTLNAAVTITDNAPDSPQMVPLIGIGVGGKPVLAGPQRMAKHAHQGLQ